MRQVTIILRCPDSHVLWVQERLNSSLEGYEIIGIDVKTIEEGK